MDLGEGENVVSVSFALIWSEISGQGKSRTKCLKSVKRG